MMVFGVVWLFALWCVFDVCTTGSVWLFALLWFDLFPQEWPMWRRRACLARLDDAIIMFSLRQFLCAKGSGAKNVITVSSSRIVVVIIFTIAIILSITTMTIIYIIYTSDTTSWRSWRSRYCCSTWYVTCRCLFTLRALNSCHIIAGILLQKESCWHTKLKQFGAETWNN